jgi:MtrB/PioB family decaheme-associated outer membrane protein
MKRTITKLSPLAAAVALALGAAPVAAQEFLGIDDLVNPRSSVKGGIGYIDGSSAWYGEYSGAVDFSERGFTPFFDLEYVTRDNDTGTWVRADAEVSRRGTFGAEYEKQGDFGLAFDYQRINRRNPLTFNTPLTGSGTPDQNVTGTVAPRDLLVETDRDDYRLTLNKQFANGLGGRVYFREMQRDGARQWGTRDKVFVTEPLDQTTREVDAAVEYTLDSLALAGGVYGTSFDNKNKELNITGGGTIPRLSLPLDSQSYQLYLKGAYAFTPSTRMNFKFAQSEATQDETFLDTAANTTRTNLDGEIETFLGYVALSSRPAENLTVTANLRYEDRQDNTPIDSYTTPPPLNRDQTRDGNNVPHSRESLTGKIEVGYQLPMGFDVIGGIGYDEIERTAPPKRAVSYADNEETSYRIELRRGMSETLNGSLSYAYRDKEADNVRLSTAEIGRTSNPGVPNNYMQPIHMADRERDEWRLMVDWMPTDPLAVTFTYTLTDDEYGKYDNVSEYGLVDGNTEVASIDASFRVSEDLTLTGWLTWDKNNIKYDTGEATDWTGEFEYKGQSAGLGLRGLVAFQHPVGADLVYGKDESSYGISAGDDLPDVEYKYTELRLWGEYLLTESSGFRADYIYTKYENNDWLWDNFEYSDGTTVSIPDDEDVSFVGVSFYYKWR